MKNQTGISGAVTSHLRNVAVAFVTDVRSHRKERISSEGRRRRKWLEGKRGKEVETVVKQKTLISDEAIKRQPWLQETENQELMDHLKIDRIFIYLISNIIYGYILSLGTTQLFGVLRYKSEGHSFDSRWCYCNFPLT